MLTRTTVSIIAMLLVAASANAVTITQNFAADPSWTKYEPTSPACSFTYMSSGYIDATLRRGPNMGAYFTALDQSYFMPQGQNGAATVSDIYIGVDIMATKNSLAAAQIGIFNTPTAGAYSTTSLNSLAFEPFPTLMMRSEKQGPAGYAGYETSTGVAITTVDTYRWQAHYFMTGANVYAQVKVTKFDALTGVKTVVADVAPILLFSSSTGGWDTTGMAAFGIRNVYRSTTTSTAVTMAVDNLYFSTDGAVNMANPSWVVPEPATMALLAIGGAVVLRRRK